MGEGRSAFKMLTNKPIVRPICNRAGIMRMDLKEGCEHKNWIDSTQDRDYWRGVVNITLNLQVPNKAMELDN